MTWFLVALIKLEHNQEMLLEMLFFPRLFLNQFLARLLTGSVAHPNKLFILQYKL